MNFFPTLISAQLLRTSLFLIPSLSVQVGKTFYIRQESSAECLPQSTTRWNPQTATWIVETGLEIQPVKIFVGHKSYHAVESFKKLDSYDYVGAKIEKEFY